MLPILLDLKFIKIYTYGVFLALAFFWGLFLLWRNVKLTSHKEEEIFDGLFISLLGALFFSRLIYVIAHFKFFGFNILKFLLINGYPGLTLYGAIIGGFLAFFLYCNRKKIPFMSMIDYMIPPLLLALGIGMLGAFFSGAEVGTSTKFILSVHYVGYKGLRHLTAIYESILLFIGAYLSNRFLFSIRREKLPKGFNFNFICFYLPGIFLLLDKLKQNHLYFLGINFNFFISLTLVFVFGIYFIYFFRKEILNKSNNLKFKGLTYVKKTFSKTNRGDQKSLNDGREKS